MFWDGGVRAWRVGVTARRVDVPGCTDTCVQTQHAYTIYIHANIQEGNFLCTHIQTPANITLLMTNPVTLLLLTQTSNRRRTLGMCDVLIVCVVVGCVVVLLCVAVCVVVMVGVVLVHIYILCHCTNPASRRKRGGGRRGVEVCVHWCVRNV